MLSALFDAPEFLTIERVVGVSGFRAQTDEFPTTIDERDLWGRKGFAKIAVCLDLAVGVEVLKVYRAPGLPDGFPCALIECDDKLMIAAIEIHNEQVLEKYWR